MLNFQEFRHVLTNIILGVLVLTAPMAANAQVRKKNGNNSQNIGSSVLGTIAAYLVPQQNQENEPPQSSNNKKTAPVVRKRPLAAVNTNSANCAPSVETKKAKTKSYTDPDGSFHRVDTDGRHLVLSPWTAKTKGVVYVIHRESTQFERFDLEGVYLSEDEIVALILGVLEASVPTGMFDDDDFYIGRAGNPVVRSSGHFKDFQDPYTRKGYAFGNHLEENVDAGVQGIWMQAFFENAHPDQQHLIESLMNIATGAYTKNGVNSQSASKEAKDIYRRRLHSSVVAIFKKHKESQDEQESFHILTDRCEQKSPSRFRDFDDDDSTGGSSDWSPPRFSLERTGISIFSGH